MKSILAAAAACAVICLSGCASIVSGRSQEILVNTNPPGATCDLVRQGNVIATVANTPGGVTIQKTKHDILLKCSKDGFQQATYFNHSGIEEMTYGNVVIGGLVGWGIDSATGSDNSYDGYVNISMVPDPVAVARAGNSNCTREELNRARIAKMNGYTRGPRCD
jgi:hypothetical protein